MVKDIYTLFSERYMKPKYREFWGYCNSSSKFNVYSDDCWNCPEKYKRCLKNHINAKKMPEYFFRHYAGRNNKNSIQYHIQPEFWPADRELTKELAVSLHRNMWDNIIKEYRRSKLPIDPFKWFEEHGYVSYKYQYIEDNSLGIHDFWPCKYARYIKNIKKSDKKICAFCPLKWPCSSNLPDDFCKCMNFSYSKFGLFKEYLINIDYSEKHFVDKVTFLHPAHNKTIANTKMWFSNSGWYNVKQTENIINYPDSEFIRNGVRYGYKKLPYEGSDTEDYFDYWLYKTNIDTIAERIRDLPINENV